MKNHQYRPTDSHGGQSDLKQAQIVVVMVPYPAQGHLNQLLQLSRIISSYNIPVHFVGSATHNRQVKLRVNGWDVNATSYIHFHDFEISHLPCPPPNPDAKEQYASSHLQEPVSVLPRSLSSEARKVIVIHDFLMGSVIQEVALISTAESYTFHSVSVFNLCLIHWESMGKPDVPDGFFPMEIPSLEGCFDNEMLHLIDSQSKHQEFNSGIVYNTYRLIEGTYLDLLEKHLKEKMEDNKKHWALGPFNPVTIPERKGSYGNHFCLEWLDKQGRNSVIFVSFGSTTTMNDEEQIKQLAIGLKQSDQRFIWILREADKGDIFNEENERRFELPEGYEESVNGMGLVVRDWVPQLEILAHPATGAFMKPIAAWPMHSDQPRNAVLITEFLKIGFAVKDSSHSEEIATSEMVESSVKRLMASDEGDKMRKRAAELGESVRQSMGENGDSRQEILFHHPYL
ncbi:hypothetical protein P3X46_009236 [Hevea brasiliensis]|uniref:Glycosyltransferase N-terminal domain-containing protein n=1 Tax=Hevea brasiliensis TaxID=3981 RepID=A0ABQ9MN51_HEVBR|nr:hypothetical protein P3X46_009236 [Hevea brasiliensis]